MNSLISPQINMVLQISILTVLCASFILKQMKKYSLHGFLMSIALVFNALSFFLIMLPSLLSLEIIRTHPFHVISVITLAHATLGMLADLIALWLVATWVFQSSNRGCFKRKKAMRLTIVLWLMALFLGFLFYAYAYTSLLF